jgi:hypothetical protein
MKPKERWGNGLHYESQRRIFTKIVKYGWDNIKHEIIASGLSEENARRIESELIHATEYDKCCNTSGNVNPNPPQKQVHEWYDDEVIEDVYEWKFEMEFGDSASEWKNNFAIDGGAPPVVTKFSKGKVELLYLYGVGENVYSKRFRIDVPSELHTYLEYFNYLQEPRKMIPVDASIMPKQVFDEKYCNKVV